MSQLEELSVDERINIANQFLLQSPPGEVNDVFNDVRGLIDNDQALHQGILPALEQHSLEQLITTTLPNVDHPVIISQYNRADGEHFIDPRSKQLFKFDHLRQTASDPQPYTVEEDAEPLREALDEALRQYASEHYPEGATLVSIYEGQLVLLLVSNKYSPANFWNGRWRSVWTLDVKAGQFTGNSKAVVHYYEDGNVQLDSKKDFTVELSDAVDPADVADYAHMVVKRLGQAEKKYQLALNDAYAQLADTTFKGLRRNLPVNRCRMNWDKVQSYKLGTELSEK